MAAPKTDETRLREFVELVEAQLRAGVERYPASGPGAVKMAGIEAVRRGWFANSDQGFTWLKRAEERLGLEPDWSEHREYRYQQPVAKFQLLPAPAPRPALLTGRISRKVVIPDRHNDPRHPHRLEATYWISLYCSEHRPEEIICLGDAITGDSVSRYDKNDTHKGKSKPLISDDLDNHLASLQAWERGRASDYKPRKKKMRGNHEQRLWEFENLHPESYGTHTLRYSQDLLQFGWQERPFGEIYYSDGVGFSHAPMAGGKPVGGKTGPLRASNDLCRSLVHGHTHKFHWYDAPKNDPMDKIAVIAAGCALPHGEIEHYATHGGATGWRYGILDMTVCDGEIIGHRWVDMRELRQLYSNDGADIAA